MTLQRKSIFLVAAVSFLLSACAHRQVATRVSVPAPVPASPADTDARSRVARADAHLSAGQRHLAEGHLVQARIEFDRAIDAYLEAPGGALSDPLLAAAYRRTLEVIHVQELQALAAGDGFTETLPEPASIDALGELPVPEAPSDGARRTAEAAIQGEANDLPIELNDAVLSCIDLYQGVLREWFESALARGGRYLPRIREILAAEGIPQDLAYVALVESAFKTNALSRAKAKGVWQFIPGTGRRFGLRQDWWVDERSDPEKATLAAAQYLRSLYELFGDWNLALAGYNAGEGRILRALSRYRVDTFWDLARKPRALRKETRNYVPMIHAAVVVAKAPETYGFAVVPEPPLTFDTVTVDGAVDLRVLAECAATSLDQMQLLNPALRRFVTPARQSFDVRVPPGAAGPVSACLRDIPAERRVTLRTHTVGRGQTLASVARRYGVRVSEIADANGISVRKRLAVGTELLIPIDPRASSPARTRPAPSSQSADRLSRVEYRIRAGDTLSRIASRFRTTVQAIQSWNGLRGTRLAAGDTLTIYTDRKF